MKTDRRRFLGNAVRGAAAFTALNALPLPAWALSAGRQTTAVADALSPVTKHVDLTVGRFPVRINGRTVHATGVNGTMPGPLLRFREGDRVTASVTNTLDEDTSIHWHGLLVPFEMDGVPGVSFPGIRPGETFTYEFTLRQHGTYWYHTHSGFQEQLGHFGPLVIDPARVHDHQEADREYVLMLSDWSSVSPHRLFAKLVGDGDSLNYQKGTFAEFLQDAESGGMGKALKKRMQWSRMRMSSRDISDITSPVYTYLINGHATDDNWVGLFRAGERIRLRIINSAAMTFFNFRIPGLPMTVIQADGVDIEPVETDEFQIGTAETYDVIIRPETDGVFPVVAESVDRTGMAVATLAPAPGMRAVPPRLRPPPQLTMKDMAMKGMDMKGMAMEGMDMHSGGPAGSMRQSGEKAAVNVPGGSSGHEAGKTETGHLHSAGGPVTETGGSRDDRCAGTLRAPLRKGPDVAAIAMAPSGRLDEPGAGLENVPHRTLRYAQLRSLHPGPDARMPEREIVLYLTSNMERYMWSFNGTRFVHVREPVRLYEGERVRLTMINNTMMSHPIHLHGMFFELVNGSGLHNPRKHTVIVKPGEELSVDISAEHVGDWAFHCHMLYHMHAGMFQVVSLLPRDRNPCVSAKKNARGKASLSGFRRHGDDGQYDAGGTDGYHAKNNEYLP